MKRRLLTMLMAAVMAGTALTGCGSDGEIDKAIVETEDEEEAVEAFHTLLRLPRKLVVKNLPANAGDVRNTGLIPGSGRFPGEGHGNRLQYSCLENPIVKRSLVGYGP